MVIFTQFSAVGALAMLVYRFLTVGIFGIAQLVFYANGVVHLYSIMQHCSTQTLPMNRGGDHKKVSKNQQSGGPLCLLG